MNHHPAPCRNDQDNEREHQAWLAGEPSVYDEVTHTEEEIIGKIVDSGFPNVSEEIKQQMVRETLAEMGQHSARNKRIEAKDSNLDMNSGSVTSD